MKKFAKFVIFKKLLIFGAKGVGKTSLTSVIENNKFEEEEDDEDEAYKGKYLFIFKIIFYFFNYRCCL
jgi:GTPase SAR1 family protein